MTGFYSKDLILEFAHSRILIDATFVYSAALIAAIFTAIYSFRLIVFTFTHIVRLNSHKIFFINYESDD